MTKKKSDYRVNYKKRYEELKEFIHEQARKLPKDVFKVNCEERGNHKSSFVIEFSVFLGFVDAASDQYEVGFYLNYAKYLSHPLWGEPIPDSKHVRLDILTENGDKTLCSLHAQDKKTEKKQIDEIKKFILALFQLILKKSKDKAREEAHKYVEFFSEFSEIDDSVESYILSGKAMNDGYGLTGSNRYPDDLNILVVPLDAFKDPARIVLPRFQLGGRWFDDVVDNNARREEGE